jgi:pimeloyl-ACP methyl ester carboxylesterase
MNKSTPNTAAKVATETLRIASDTSDIELQLRNKRRADHDAFTSERTLVLMHGATFSSASLFDVEVGGASFMDVLARAGFDVWAVDVRGYGGSIRPAAMEQPPSEGEPLVRAPEATRDLASAVEFVCRHRGIERVSVLGMSWGGSVAGIYASRNGGRVGKLTLVAPLWLSHTPLRIDGGGAIPNYRLADVRAFETAWRGSAPEAKRADLIPGGWFERWAAATLATDPGSPAPGSVRAPAGAIADVREHWTADRPLYDPAAIRSPVLIVRGEWDVDVTRRMAADLFDRLTGASYRRSVEIGEATHMLLMEKYRRQAYDAVIGFLQEDGTEPTFSHSTDS